MLRRLDYKWLVAITFVLGLIMQILDLTVLNVALATLGREFHTGAATLQWVLTGYIISLAVFIPASGWISDRFGSKRTFMFAVAVFTAASVLCGFAPGIGWLIIARVVQGVGGGMLVPVGQAMLFRAFPPHERAKASAVLMIPIAVAPALGPVLGGLLVEYASWRWIFFINVPVGVVALVFTVLFLREEGRAKAGRFDAPGFVLAGAGLALLLLGLDRGAQDGWSQLHVWGSMVVGAVLLAALVFRELRTAEPIVHLRLLRQRMFASGNAALLCATGGMFGVLFLLPLYMQTLRGVPALTAGLVLMPGAFGMLTASQFVGRLYGIIGPRRLVLAAFLVIGGTTLLLQLIGLTTPLAVIAVLMFTQGIGMGLALVPLQTATFAQTRQAQMGRATALFNATRQVAVAAGVAALATVLVTRTNAELGGLGAAVTSAGARAAAQMQAYHAAFLAAVLFSVAGIFVALLIRDTDAAATMDSRARRAEPRREPEPSTAG